MGRFHPATLYILTGHGRAESTKVGLRLWPKRVKVAERRKPSGRLGFTRQPGRSPCKTNPGSSLPESVRKQLANQIVAQSFPSQLQVARHIK